MAWQPPSQVDREGRNGAAEEFYGALGEALEGKNTRWNASVCRDSRRLHQGQKFLASEDFGPVFDPFPAKLFLQELDEVVHQAEQVGVARLGVPIARRSAIHPHRHCRLCPPARR